MGIFRILRPSDDNSAGVVMGHIIRVFNAGTNVVVGEYAPALASPISSPSMSYDVTIADGTYDIEYINPNLIDSIIQPRVYSYVAATGYSYTDLVSTAFSLNAGQTKKFTNVVVGSSDKVYLDSANRRMSTTVKAKVVGSGSKRFGSADGSAKTLDNVSIALGSSYFPSVDFQDVTTSVSLGLTLPNSQAYAQFNYYIAEMVDGAAPVNVFIPVNNATGAYVRIDTQPTKGVLSNLNPTLGTVTYTPNVGETGTDSFTYSIVSSNGSTLSTATATVMITAQGQTATPVFAERAFGLNDSIKVVATNGIKGGTAVLYSAAGDVLQTVVDSSGNGYVEFSGLTFTEGQQLKATWTEVNKTEALPTGLITVYPKPVATNKSITTDFNTSVTINVLDGDINTANMPNF